MFDDLAKIESVYDYTELECQPYQPFDHSSSVSGGSSNDGKAAAPMAAAARDDGSGWALAGEEEGGFSGGAERAAVVGGGGDNGRGALGPIVARAFIVPADGITAQQLAIKARGSDGELPSARWADEGGLGVGFAT
jgi:hypothetical protein